MYAWVIAAALALPAPAPVAAMDTAPPTQVMALPPALQARLRAEVLADNPSQTRRLDRLADFMFDPQGLGMVYAEDATYSVEQAYATRTANCLSFTLLFLALAREAGLDAYPQEVGETLAWRQHEGVIYRNNHVNAGVRIGGRVFVVDVAGDSIIAKKIPARVSDRRLLAHYYNNLAVNDLEIGKTASALRNMATALELDPDYAPHWSNAGVLHLRDGDAEAAEQAYTKALDLDPLDASTLFNMAGLSHRNGDRRREAEFRRRLARVQQKDPFHHFLQAKDFERVGDYPRAIEHYRRAIRLHRGEHRFYSALAHAYLQAGDTRRAAKALASAQAYSDGSTRAAYQSQLDGLRRVAD